ncbi:MAG TPA: redoxin domain-containing protein, partial [Planctomycetota bacterium]|nr:redoxin domain-containing protein [Planctomycetota bacterium]
MPLAWLLPLLLQSPAAASPAHPQALGKAPDFTLPSIRERRLVSLREFAGKVLYLEVSRSECPRTRAQAADLAELRRKYQDRGFEVLTVADEIF